jgi:hypothetical protein
MFPSDPALQVIHAVWRGAPGLTSRKARCSPAFRLATKKNGPMSVIFQIGAPALPPGLFFGLAAIKENPARGERGFPNPFGEH